MTLQHTRFTVRRHADRTVLELAPRRDAATLGAFACVFGFFGLLAATDYVPLLQAEPGRGLHAINPFSVVITAVLFATALWECLGRCRIEVAPHSVKVSRRLFGLAWTRTFPRGEVRDVHLHAHRTTRGRVWYTVAFYSGARLVNATTVVSPADGVDIVRGLSELS